MKATTLITLLVTITAFILLTRTIFSSPPSPPPSTRHGKIGEAKPGSKAILLHGGDVKESHLGPREIQRQATITEDEEQMLIVQLGGERVHDEVKKRVEDDVFGGRPVLSSYLPHNAFLVQGSRAEARAAADHPDISFVGYLAPKFKTSPSLDVGSVENVVVAGHTRTGAQRVVDDLFTACAQSSFPCPSTMEVEPKPVRSSKFTLSHVSSAVVDFLIAHPLTVFVEEKPVIRLSTKQHLNL